MRRGERATSVAPAPLLMALEPRVVYDGSAVAAGAAAAQHHADPVAGGLAVAGEVAGHHVDGKAAAAKAAASPDTHKDVPKNAQPAAVSAGDAEVVFVDPAVTNAQALIANLPADARAVVLDPGRDGFAQIANYLEAHPGVRTVDLVSHGSEGQLQVGSTVLQLSDLTQHSAELNQIGAAMQPGGSILLYGCDVAGGSDGQMLVQGIASLTHESVAASTDLTGAAALGGNWTLEYHVGAPTASTLLTATTEQHYDGLLTQTVENYDGDVGFDTGSTPVTTFSRDGIAYTGDQGAEYQVVSGSLPSSGSGGELVVNTQGTQMAWMTMQLQDGDEMAVRSFDIDIFVSNQVTVEGLDSSGNVIATKTLDYASTADGHTQYSSLFHVDLSNDLGFSGGVKTLRFVETSGNGTYLSPTLDNFTYVDIAPGSAPTMTASGGSTSFTEADNTASTPVVIDSAITLADGNATTANQATVSLTGNFSSGQDVLSFTNTSAALYGGISGAYNGTTGVLTLASANGAATITQWQNAFRAVTYTNTAAAPSTATRTISFQLTHDADGVSSNAVTKDVTVTATDQTPIVTTTGGTTNYRGGTSAVTIDNGVTVSDLDNTTQSSGTVSVSGGFHSGDVLSFTNDGSTMGNVTASYNAGTGVLTLTSAGSTATLAQWRSALDAVTFSSTSTTYGNRTISFATSDGTKTSVAATDTVGMTAPPKLTTDSGSAAFVAGDNTASTPVAVDSGLTVTDGSSTTLASTTVAITGGFHSGEDVLGFTNDGATMGNITASYNAGTGVLTLTSSGATATLAQWQSALRSVTYTDTAVTPNSATRTISFSGVDGGGVTSATAPRTVTVTDTDQTPVVTTTGGTTTYVGGATAVTIDSGISVGDLDNTTQSSGTVSVSGGFHAGDTLSFTNDGATMGNITASYNAATGVLTLTSAGGTATLAQWRSALDAVTFSSTSTTYGNRTISFATSDGTKTSVAATDTVGMTAPPKLTTDSGSAAFVAGDNTASTPVAVDSGLTVTDGSSTTLASTTVAITGGFHSGEDVLGFTNDGATMGNITASYNAGTGVLTLTSSGATATLAQWQSALDSVTYTDTAVTPNTTTRTVSFTAVDGAGNTSATSSRTVTVADTDQTPIVTTTGGTTTYVGGTSAVSIDGGIAVSDLDNTTQSSGSVSISGGFHSGDVLSFTNDGSTMGNVTASYNAGTGVLTLTSAGSTATLAQWRSALDAVTFSSTSTTYGNRTISFATSDGTKTSVAATDTVGMTAPPKLTTDSGSAAFVAGDNTASTPVAVDSGLTVTDGSSTTLASTTVAITGGFHSGEDVLGFTNDGATMGNITASYNAGTGVLTLTSSGATATLAQWQSALDSVTYTDTAVTPNTTTRTVSFTAIDGGGVTSATATRTVTVTDTDQTPIVTTTGGTTSYVGATSAVTIDGGVTVSDLDNTTQSSGTVSVSGGFHSGDTLSFTNTSSATYGNITASFNAATGVLTLSSAGATATEAQWADALSSVTFSSTSTTYGNRTISFATSDGTKTSVAASDTVSVLGPPKLTTDSGSAAFVAGDNTASTPVAVDSGLTVTDGSSTTLASTTVAITGGFHSGEDVLGFTNDGATMGNITASYNAGTGVLTLTSSGATATLAQWQSALDSVTYTDTAVTPNTTTRTVSFTAVDGAGNTSTTSTRTVTVADTDQTPVVTTTGGTTTYVGGAAAVTIDSGISVSDLDNTTQSSGSVSISSGFHSGDTLSFTNDGAMMGNITASYNAATGVLTLTSAGSTATDAQWANALEAVTFSASASVTPGNRTLSFTTSDGTKTSVAATDTVSVSGPPVLTADSGSAAFVAGDNTASTPIAVDGGVTVADASSSTLQSATVSITGNFQSGEDVLVFANTSTTTYGDVSGVYDSGTGVLTLTSSGGATLAQWQAALQAVTYTDSAVTPNTATRTVSFTVTDGASHASNTVTRTVTVTDTDQTPVVTTSGGSTAFVAGDNAASLPVTIDAGVIVGDRDNATLASATVSISGDFVAGEDVLTFVNDGATMGNVTGAYDAATGVLTLSSAGATATTAQWQAALESVTYADTALTPNDATRTVSFSVSDGVKSSVAATRTVTVADTDQTPIVTTTGGGSTAFVAGDNAASIPVTIDPGITVGDRDNGSLASATVSISGGFAAGEDVLAFVNDGSTMGDIAGVYDASTGVLTLSSAGGSATTAQWRAALASVTYVDTAITPNDATRTISFSVNDGAKSSAAATRTVTVADTDQTPIVTTTGGGSTAFVAGDNAASVPVAIDPGVAIGDRDNGSLASATVSISGGFAAGEDVLGFRNDGATMGDIAGAYDASTGVLTLTSADGSATTAQWRAALASVTYADTAITPNDATRTISFSVNDGARSSAVATRTVTVADTDQTPTIATSTGEVRYTAGDPGVLVDGGVTLGDRDNATLASGTVSISAGLQAGDVLAFAGGGGTGNIIGSYDPSTGVLTLTSAGATATQAQWQAAFGAVTYAGSAQTSPGTRTIAFAVSDGTKMSAAAQRTLDVAVDRGVIVPPQQSPPMITSRVEAGSDEAPSTETGTTAPAVIMALDHPLALDATPAPRTFTILTPSSPTPPPPPPSEITVFTPPPVVDRIQLSQDRAFAVTLAAPSPDGRDAGTSAQTVVSVRQADGAPLPSWIRYDPTTGKLTGAAPPGVSGVLRMVVTERDSLGHVRLHVVEVNLGTQQSAIAPGAAQAVAPLAGKPSLAAQFARESHDLHVAHRPPLSTRRPSVRA